MSRKKLYTGDKRFLYEGEYPIRWDDVDSYRHVSLHIYYMYMIEVRYQWFNKLPFSKEIELFVPTVSASSQYYRALTYPGNALIKVYGTPTTDKTFTFYHEVFHSKKPDELCAEALVELIYIDHNTQKPTSLPDNFRNAIYAVKSDDEK